MERSYSYDLRLNFLSVIKISCPSAISPPRYLERLPIRSSMTACFLLWRPSLWITILASSKWLRTVSYLCCSCTPSTNQRLSLSQYGCASSLQLPGDSLSCSATPQLPQLQLLIQLRLFIDLRIYQILVGL